jgi:hypothetical protein
MRKSSNKIWILLGFFLLLIFIGCGGKKLQSRWNDMELVVDGLGKDWPGYILEYTEKAGFAFVYAFANDEKSVNLMFRFEDKGFARMINTRGLTVWFDENDKKNKNFGIYYRDPNAIEDAYADLERLKFNRETGEGGFFEPPPQELTGYFSLVNRDTTIIPSKGLNGIEAMASHRNGEYCFEFRVPVKSDNDTYSLKTSAGRKIKVGIEIAAVSEEVREQMKEEMERMSEEMGNRAGGPPGGGGGFPEGGMRGGGMPGDPGRGRQMTDLDEKNLWVTVVLADSPNKDVAIE